MKWTHYLSIPENTGSCRNRLKKHRIYQILCLMKELCVLLCICLGIFSILQTRELRREKSRIEKFKNAENVKDYLKDTLQYLPLYINIIIIIQIFVFCIFACPFTNKVYSNYFSKWRLVTWINALLISDVYYIVLYSMYCSVMLFTSL